MDNDNLIKILLHGYTLADTIVYGYYGLIDAELKLRETPEVVDVIPAYKIGYQFLIHLN